MLSSVSTWMGESGSSVALVLLITHKGRLDLISRVLFTGCWFCVDAELAIGQYRLGVHGTCGLNKPWHRTCGRCHNRVGIPISPPFVIPRGSAG